MSAASHRHHRLTATALLLVAISLGVTSCSDGGSSSGGPDKERFCAKVGEFNEGTAAFDLNVADDAEVDRVAQLLDEIADAAPEEIRDDVAARFAYVDDVIAASRGDQDAAQRLGEAEPTDEQQGRIDAYAQRECGIALDPGGSTTPATSVPGATTPTVPTALANTVPPTSVPTSTAPPTTVALA